MRFRSQHIADSVAERITGIADSIRNDAPLPPSKGAAAISLVRSDNGDLVVTKSFEHGEPEVMTISGQAPTPGLPDGFVDVTPAADTQQNAPSVPGLAGDAVVGNAAIGGDAVDALLGTQS